MSPFVRIITLAAICAAALAGAAGVIAEAGEAGSQTDPYAGLKFILESQGGFSTYAQITGSFNLSTMRQAYAVIYRETPDYIVGTYTLAGRGDQVILGLTATGWAIASMNKSLGVEHLYDAYVDFGVNESWKAINEIAAMAHVASTVTGCYDFGHPTATGAIMHWLYQTGNKDQSSSITLPIEDLYLDRGYAYFTAASNAQFWVNGQLLQNRSPGLSIIYLWDKLSSQQLRAGQSNTLRQNSLTLFGTGFVAGVAVLYSGPITPTTSGGNTGTFALSYPAQIGEPLVLQHAFMSFMSR